MKLIKIYLVSIIFSLQLYAQNEHKVITVSIKEDTSMIREYIELYRYYQRTYNFDKRKQMLDKAYAKSLKINNTYFIAYCEELYANQYVEEEIENPLGTKFSLSAIKNYKSLNDEKYYHKIADLYIHLLQIDFKSQNNLSVQLYADSAILYTNKIKNDKYRLISLMNILLTLYRNNDKNTDLTYLQNTKDYLSEINKLFPKVNDRELRNVCIRLNEMQLVAEKKYQQAIKYNLTSIKYNLSINDTGGIMYDYLRRSEIHNKIMQFNESKYFNEKGLIIATQYKHTKYELIFLYELAINYYNLKKYELSYQYSLKSMSLSKKIKAENDIMKNYHLLYKLDSINQNHNSALRNLQQYYKYRDSLFPVSYNKKAIALAQHFEIAKMKNVTNKLKRENLSKDEEIKKDAFKIIYLSIAAVLFLLMSMFFFFFYRKFAKQSVELTVQKNLISKQVLELENQNQKLERMNQEKTDLIGIVSHDLKAPLNRAQALIDLIIMDETSTFNITQQNLFQKLKSEITDEKALITEILNAELLEIEINSIKNEKIEINQAIEVFIQNFIPLAETKDIKLTLKPFADKIHIYANLNYLRRAFDNLLSNAIKFSNTGKTVSVLIDKVDNEVFLHIIDQGLGFSEEDQKNLFRKYRKLSSKPTAGEASTGLGLSIVKSLVEAMDGTISLISEKNKGATFTLKFKSA